MRWIKMMIVFTTLFYLLLPTTNDHLLQAEASITAKSLKAVQIKDRSYGWKWTAYPEYIYSPDGITVTTGTTPPASAKWVTLKSFSTYDYSYGWESTGSSEYVYSLDGFTISTSTGTVPPANAKWVSLKAVQIKDHSYGWKWTAYPEYIYSPDGITVTTGTAPPASAKWVTLKSFSIYDYSYGWESTGTSEYVDYAINQDPIISILTPVTNLPFSEVTGFNIINCSINAYDLDVGDVITSIKYSIDTDLSTDLAAAKNVLNTNPSLPRAAQNSPSGETYTFNIKPFNDYPALSDGPHTLFIYIQDDKGGVGTATVSFIADRTPPTLMGTLKQVVAKDSYVKLNFSASDSSLGVVLEYSCTGLTGSGMNAVESPLIFLDSTQAAYGEGKLVTGTVRAMDPVGNSINQSVKIKIDSSGSTSPGSL